ncbi:MAG TPA: M20/M25/M40 family metallo-hydrolase [Blastocatellia bacterium]|nr:M20/M25/M40 family metallo-hydrolase [Blastocatellia bacterium]
MSQVISAEPLASLLQSPQIVEAFELIDRISAEVEDEAVRICEIPAPPFEEAARRAYVRSRFLELGLTDVQEDDEGNLLSCRAGETSLPSIVFAAHLDTVFPEGTDVRVKRRGNRLMAPGISDNSCGVASLITLARVLNEVGLATRGTVYFVGTVGEEGEGNLRGVRYLFRDGLFKSGVDAFVSLDGPGLDRVTNAALGSRRYRVTITGPGGHSWGDFGIVNPIHALGRALARLAAYPAPSTPRTSFNAGLIDGGNSVNAIPQWASFSVDIRSVSDTEIDKLESYLKHIVDIAVREEDSQRTLSSTRLEYEIEMIGDRPSGATPPESHLVRAATECSRAVGIEAHLDCSSTDSNIPISLGIPAITLGVGGASANCHSLNEWYEPTGREAGLKRLVLLAMLLAG